MSRLNAATVPRTVMTDASQILQARRAVRPYATCRWRAARSPVLCGDFLHHLERRNGDLSTQPRTGDWHIGDDEARSNQCTDAQVDVAGADNVARDDVVRISPPSGTS
jgi:hypothetical protein